MSDKSNITKEPTTKTEQMDCTNIKVGFIVGVRDDGSYLFEPIGPEAGLLELFGLTEYAQWRLQKVREVADKGDDLTHLRKTCETTATMVRAIIHTLVQEKKEEDISVAPEKVSTSPADPPIS